jgi:hypothetical protein
MADGRRGNVSDTGPTTLNLKPLAKKLLGPNGVSRLRYWRDSVRIAVIRTLTRFSGFRYLNIGGGQEQCGIGWWNGDSQIGYVIDDQTELPFADGSIEFVYSSMFSVPNFWLWMEHDRNKDAKALHTDDPNLRTWGQYGVPVDLEHLFVQRIAAIENKPVVITPYPHREDPGASPPVFTFPHDNKYKGYYCGPAPEMTTEAIRDHVERLTPEQILDWIFQETGDSKFQFPGLNFWHKNWWNLEKIKEFARNAGFSEITPSAFGESPIPLPPNIEIPHHKDYGLYFNLRAQNQTQ